MIPGVPNQLWVEKDIIYLRPVARSSYTYPIEVVPEGVGWDLTLNSGELRYYPPPVVHYTSTVESLTYVDYAANYGWMNNTLKEKWAPEEHVTFSASIAYGWLSANLKESSSLESMTYGPVSVAHGWLNFALIEHTTEPEALIYTPSVTGGSLNYVG